MTSLALSSRYARAYGAECPVCGQSGSWHGRSCLRHVLGKIDPEWVWMCPLCDQLEDAYLAADPRRRPAFFSARALRDWAVAEMERSLDPAPLLVTWWRHAHPGQPLPVEALRLAEAGLPPAFSVEVAPRGLEWRVTVRTAAAVITSEIFVGLGAALDAANSVESLLAATGRLGLEFDPVQFLRSAPGYLPPPRPRWLCNRHDRRRAQARLREDSQE